MQLDNRIVRRSLGALAAAAAAGALIGTALGDGGHGPSPLERRGDAATWTTVFKGTLAGIEGLTGDAQGFLYVAERGGSGNPCPVWKIDPTTAAKTQVGTVPAPCSPSGLAFGPDGRLYITGIGSAQDAIDALTPGDATSTATVFATGVPQANGVAFDRDGNLWATDGNLKKGIVYRVGPAGGAASEVFRIPPMANAIGVGRQNTTLQGATPNTGQAQDIVSNGIAFTPDGDVLVADTARGAIWKVQLDVGGNPRSPMGCDTTYPSAADTLCLDDVLAQSPYLEGADGFVLDRAGRIWVDANERQAIVVVEKDGAIEEFFRNPAGPDSRRNTGPLETPTSPFLLGKTLCTTSSDGNRRDNFPSSAGETAGKGKISCMDQQLDTPGLPLPIRG
ncbi:MAG: Vgb family protein [Gaiellaceae bacterium]